jgi:hypothetical protein
MLWRKVARGYQIGVGGIGGEVGGGKILISSCYNLNKITFIIAATILVVLDITDLTLRTQL